MAPTVCMPGKFAALCSKLKEEQKRVVKEIGFESLLSIPAMPIQRILLESLAENYNEVDRSFTLRDHVVPISTWDVYCILGLVDRGDKIEISTKKADPKWFNLYKGIDDTTITLKHLEERIASGAADDHFARMFVLYTIGTVLAPSSKEYVSSRYVDLVANISKIEGYNWAQFTLDYLMDHLALFKKNKRTGLVGNLAFLQVWFFEHFQAAGDCFDYALHEHPLIKNWGESKVVKRAHLEGIKKFGAEKVVIRLELNDSKARTDSDHLDEEIGEGSTEGMNSDYFENEDFTDNVEKEEINLDGSHDAEKGDECHRKDTLESIKGMLSALEQDTHRNYTSLDGRIQVIEDRTRLLPELHTIVQMIIKLLDGSNRPTTCEEKQCGSLGSSELGKSHSNVQKKSDRTNRAKNKDKVETGNSKVNNGKNTSNGKTGKPCREPVTDPERTYSSGTSKCDRSNIFGGVKRKIDLVSSPTLVQKVKTRTDRQPSKICKSPYEGIKRKRIFGTKTDGAHVDEVTEGLDLSELELAAIKFVQKELALGADKVLVRIGLSELRGSLLRSLIRPVRENGTDKWLNSEIITSYVSIFNSVWEKEPKQLKHAVSAYHSDWLRSIGKDWIKTGSFSKNVGHFTHKFCQSFVGADMVFIPINTTNSHWWLCVLYPSKKEFQILDSYNRRINYAEESRDLRSGIHSILQAVRSSPPKLESRWSNYDILNWDVVVMKNIPRQLDVCSCGIFTIKYMQYWNGSELTSDFSQEDMETFRKKMPAELFFSPLNDLNSIKDDVLVMANS